MVNKEFAMLCEMHPNLPTIMRVLYLEPMDLLPYVVPHPEDLEEDLLLLEAIGMLECVGEREDAPRGKRRDEGAGCPLTSLLPSAHL